MEEFENEYDKGIYWVVFFFGLLIIGLLGHHFVFSYSNNEKEDKKVIEETKEEDVDSYKGVWQLFDIDEDYPAQELCINYIDGSTITFDYFLKEGYKFESQTAHLEDNNVAMFEINDEEERKITGKIIFKNNKVFLAITSSDIEDITTGTIEFNLRVEDSLLN